MAMEVSAAREWIQNIKSGIVNDEWFGPIVHSLANPSPRPPPFTGSSKQLRLWASAQRFSLEENSLLWVHGDFERKQEEKKTWEKKRDKEEVEITVRANEKEEDEKAEKEEEGKVEKRG
jgi:hypothetical protein